MNHTAEPGGSGRFIDLHAHTNESDGSLTPEELVELAKRNDLDALAITDHDTFLGYEKAAAPARAAGLDLVAGIELNSKLEVESGRQRSMHLLAYFPVEGPPPEFLSWLEDERKKRQDRNRRLAETLAARGVDVTLSEVEARGRSLAGRVHFARILVEKGYASDTEDAFRRFLGEDAPTYVRRESKTAEEVIGIVARAGGVPVVAHPVRLSIPREREPEVFSRLKRAGLMGLEIYHSEHAPAVQAHYRQLAEELDLLPTGGSDFHGTVKPDVALGTGVNGNVRVPAEFLDRMRAMALRS